MIMHKGKQVGFIQHENNNIDKVMHNGNCVFEQGYPRDNNTITGDIVLDGTIGKSLKSWSITGNTVQDGTPSPDNPVEIQSVGERTKNLFDKNDATVPGYINESGSVTKTSPWFTLANFIECSGTISISAQNGLGSAAYVACYDENKTFLGTVAMSSNNSTTATLTLLDGTVYIKACSRDNSLDTFMLNLGDTPLPYEPYGYKIPVVNRGKNLLKLKDGDYDVRGVSVIISHDVITVKGTATSSGGRTVPLSYTFDLQPGKYRLKRCNLKYGTSSAGHVDCITKNDDSTALVAGSGGFSVTNDTTVYYGINVVTGKTYDLSFQIELIDVSDSYQYEPYREPITTPIYLSEPLRIGETLNSDGTRDVKWTAIELKNLKFNNETELSRFTAYMPSNFFRQSSQQSRSIKAYSDIYECLYNGESFDSSWNNKFYFGIGSGSASIYIHDKRFDSVTEFISAVGEHVIYYQLATPTTETIEVPQIPTFRNTPTIKGIMTSLSVDTTIKPSATNVSFRSTNKYQRFISRYIDFDNNKMSTISGDFSNIRAFTNRRRCNVLDDGTISAFYGDDNYVEDGSNGQVMVYQPKFYYKVEPIRLEPITDSIGYHIREAIYSVSDIPLTGYKLHPAFINEAGNEVDYFCLSAYEGCAYDVSNSAYITNDSQTVDFTADTGDKLSSIANVKPMTGLTQQLTRPNSEIIAKNRGAGWHTYGIKQASANQMLMFIEYGNLQSNIGLGVVSISDNSSYNCSSYTGSTSSLGNTTGRATSTINEIGGTETTYTDNGKTSISYRGMENPYGNIWDFVYGVNIHGDGTQRSGIPYICTDYNYAESKNSGNYVSAGFTTVNAAGYIKAFGYGNPEYDWLFMGSDTGGASNGIIGDYHYVTANFNGYKIALLGGSWHYGSYAGGFDWSLGSGVGTRTRGIGARLCYVPQS